MEAACWRTAKSLRFRHPCTPHTITVMVMVFAFHTKELDRLGDALNVFLFPNLSPFARLEAALLTRKWDAILGGSTLTFFVDTILIMGKQKFVPIAGCDEAAYQIEARDLLCTVFLGDNRVHPATYKMFLLLEETSGVSPRPFWPSVLAGATYKEAIC